MFKVGEYPEDEAKTIAGYLKDAGIKVDMKGLVLARTDFTASLQGKIIEIKGKAPSEYVEQSERSLAAVKAVLEKGATEETFRDLFLDELNPGWKDSFQKFEESSESSEQMDEEERMKLTSIIAECIISLDFAEKVMELNGIKFGEPLAGRLDDPVISVPVDAGDYEDDEPMLMRRMDVDLVKRYEITIDEFYAPLYEEIDDCFRDDYTDEYLRIQALGIVMEGLINEPEKGKVNIEKFAERCIVDVGDKDVMSIDASLVAEEIARSLEKKGIVKVKGDTIKWKA